MNQILITKKLYVTPELKRKKKVYKFSFIFSIFFICILISLCIYAEYDRNKSEEVSQQILANIEQQEDNTIAKSNALVVILNNDSNGQESEETNEQETQQTQQIQQNQEPQNQVETGISPNGYKYAIVGRINIPKINVNYPILEGLTARTDEEEVKETEELLKISPCKFWGPDINEVGNYCIVGHNYRNKRFFSKVPTLTNGDVIEITANRKTVSYSVYNMYKVIPEDNSCTTQETDGRKEITLITCTDDSKQRVIVKAREIK